MTSSPPANDGAPALHEPDAHGQAALLLAESTLHGLVEARVLTSVEAASIVRTAADVKREVATMAGESEARMLHSLALLAKIQGSLEIDAGSGRSVEELKTWGECATPPKPHVFI